MECARGRGFPESLEMPEGYGVRLAHGRPQTCGDAQGKGVPQEDASVLQSTGFRTRTGCSRGVGVPARERGVPRAGRSQGCRTPRLWGPQGTGVTQEDSPKEWASPKVWECPREWSTLGGLRGYPGADGGA